MTTPGHERMSSVDTAWLRMDGPANSMMIVGVSVTGTPVPPADFRRGQNRDQLGHNPKLKKALGHHCHQFEYRQLYRKLYLEMHSKSNLAG